MQAASAAAEAASVPVAEASSCCAGAICRNRGCVSSLSPDLSCLQMQLAGYSKHAQRAAAGHELVAPMTAYEQLHNCQMQ